MPSRTTLPKIGRRLTSARLHRGLSQGTVARLAGIAPSYLSRIETGKVHPTLRTMTRISRALKVGLDQLVAPRAGARADPGACPISTSGHCMLDLMRSDVQAARVGGGEVYTTREVRLLQSLALWMRGATPDRLKAMQILLDEMLAARAGAEEGEAGRRPAGPGSRKAT